MGEMPGRIARSPQRQQWFGVQPLFVLLLRPCYRSAAGAERAAPDQCQMSPEQKDAISHRGAAIIWPRVLRNSYKAGCGKRGLYRNSRNEYLCAKGLEPSSKRNTELNHQRVYQFRHSRYLYTIQTPARQTTYIILYCWQLY